MPNPSETLTLRFATRKDVPLVLGFIRALADFEKLAHEVVATEATLADSLFGNRPMAEVILAYAGHEPVGFALFFHNFSTFLGQPGIYLEDLFIQPASRGRGYGKQVLTHLARIARDRGCGRLEWSVLDWNEDAIRFYKRLGATPMDEWTVFRVTGDALERLAGES